MYLDITTPAEKMKTCIILAVTLFASSFTNAIHDHSPLSPRHDFPLSPHLELNDVIPNPGRSPAKIGRIIEGHSLLWGESIGWINLKTAHTDLQIGSNILAGWVWLENCGWVCLGEGHPLKGNRYSNKSAYDWGVNNAGQGNLSGYAWSEVTGWISFRTGHSRVYLDEKGQFCGYAWGENVGWMHFGPGRTVQYLAKADRGPWKEIGPESEGRLAGGPDDSEMTGGSVPVSGLSNSHERYNEDADSVCELRVAGDDFSTHIRYCDTPVYISSLASLFLIRAPPQCG